ncbi:hypothetical protein V6N13_081643 [Hibiscus sabdariffa]
MQEGREAIKASLKGNIENTFELKRLSLGGPDPHHHSRSHRAICFYGIPHQAIKDEVKATSPLKKFTSLPHLSEQLTKAASVTFATVKANESKKFSNGKNKSALMQEGRQAIKASMKRNIWNPFELKRLSLGGPDPHHHW